MELILGIDLSVAAGRWPAGAAIRRGYAPGNNLEKPGSNSGFHGPAPVLGGALEPEQQKVSAADMEAPENLRSRGNMGAHVLHARGRSAWLPNTRTSTEVACT